MQLLFAVLALIPTIRAFLIGATMPELVRCLQPEGR